MWIEDAMKIWRNGTWEPILPQDALYEKNPQLLCETYEEVKLIFGDRDPSHPVPRESFVLGEVKV